MQITEQLIERIARRVFNAMFAPALRQSNVQGGGTPASVRYAEEAGHAASADTADAVPWAGVSGKPSFATVATSGSYNDLSNKPSIPSVSGSVSGSTLTITINGSSYSLTDTNTWRPVQNTLDSTSTSDSLSAYQGYLLARGYARDDSKLPLTGGTMSGAITFSQYGTTINFAGGESLDGYGNFYFGNNSQTWSVSNGNSHLLIVQKSTGNVGIGTDSPSYKLHVAGKIYCTGGFAFLSDIRKKDVITKDIHISVGDIAKAPLIRYTLKSDEKKEMHIGSVAQYWQNVMPETINKSNDGTLSMDYGTISLVSVVTLARKLETMEKELSDIQKKLIKK